MCVCFLHQNLGTRSEEKELLSLSLSSTLPCFLPLSLVETNSLADALHSKLWQSRWESHSLPKSKLNSRHGQVLIGKLYLVPWGTVSHCKWFIGEMHPRMHLEVAAQGWVSSDLRRLGSCICHPSNVCVLLQFYNERNLRWHTHTLKYITHNNTTHSLDRTSSNLIGWPYACPLQDSGLLQWLLLEGLITGVAKVYMDCDINSFILGT